MPTAAALTSTIDPSVSGAILTFLTPAAQGCGMACGYCFIDRRGEDTLSEVLQPADYARFIREAAALQPVAAVTIQGREPLAPSALPWTEAILAAGAAAGAETGMVTNGLWLKDNVAMLKRLGCSGVTVSIDADTPEWHDRLRRAPGAWRRAMEGLRAASRQGAVKRLAVNSLLFKGAAGRLADMPRHLEEAGVRLWSLSPLLRFDGEGSPHPAMTATEWHESIGFLSARAAQHGITVIADDEFRTMEEAQVPEVIIRSLSRPEGILRMGPDGRCSFGKGILDGIGRGGWTWTPGMAVSEVLQRMPH